MEPLLTPRQVAERLAVSPRTVYLWIESGRLPAIRLSERVTRISEAALSSLMGAGANGASCAAETLATYRASDEIALVEPPRSISAASRRLRGLLHVHRDEMRAIAGRRRAENVRVFGSVARGDARDDSDIDLLVDLKPHASVWDLSGLGAELELLLGVPCDVVPVRGLRPEMREQALSEAIPL